MLYIAFVYLNKYITYPLCCLFDDTLQKFFIPDEFRQPEGLLEGWAFDFRHVLSWVLEAKYTIDKGFTIAFELILIEKKTTLTNET